MPEAARPMLGEIELLLVQQITITEEQILVHHAVSGLDGDLLQRLNRDTTAIRLHGVLVGDDAKANLERLRQAFQAVEPLAFVADIMTATQVQQVVIADLDVEELAGRPERFGYRLTLREYVPPPPAEEVRHVDDEAQGEADAAQEDAEDQVADDTGVLEVTVELAEGDTDYSRIAVVVEGATESGEDFSNTIDDQTEGVYRLENLRPGTYSVRTIVR